MIWKKFYTWGGSLFLWGVTKNISFKVFFSHRKREKNKQGAASMLAVGGAIPRSLLLRPPLAIVETLGGLVWRLQCRPWENVIDVCLAFNSLFTGRENTRQLSPLRRKPAKMK